MLSKVYRAMPTNAGDVVLARPRTGGFALGAPVSSPTQFTNDLRPMGSAKGTTG